MRMLTSGRVSISVVKREMPTRFAKRRPVAGRICMSPYAFAGDRTAGMNVDSCAMRAATT